MLSCGNLFAAIVVAYLALTIHQLYKLANPLNGVAVDGPGIEPLWKEGQKYDIACFLSTSQAFENTNFARVASESSFVFEKKGLVHSSRQDSVEVSTTIEVSDASLAKDRSTPSKGVFSNIQSNSSEVYLHVVVKMDNYNFSQIQPYQKSPGWWIHGSVKMIKHDYIPRSFRYRYLLSDFGYVKEDPIQEKRLTMQKNDIISYWKPQVSVHMVADFAKYPFDKIPDSVARNIMVKSFAQSKRGKQKSIRIDTSRDHHYRPSMYVDETGLTTDKYINLNESVAALPLKISIGPMSSQRWLLMSILEDALAAQTSLGFSERDIDDIRRLVTETSLTFLLITMIASTLHLLFEYLAFRSDMEFWNDNKSLAGLSTRSLLTDLVSQVIVFLYLIESDASLLVIIPSFIGIAIQLWKAKKATGLTLSLGGPYLLTITFQRWSIAEGDDDRHSTNNDEKEKEKRKDTASLLATSRNNTAASVDANSSKSGGRPAMATSEVDADREENDKKLVQITLEADRMATKYIGGVLLPFVLAFVARSLIYERHLSWYSWFIGSCTSCVYSFGFVLMCPQLYINHRLKSVSHLPWQFLIYKFLNTFVDDLFAFVIKMPMMHRLSVFRDDIVFLIYLYQRWIYQVDKSRPYEK